MSHSKHLVVDQLDYIQDVLEKNIRKDFEKIFPCNLTKTLLHDSNSHFRLSFILPKNIV